MQHISISQGNRKMGSIPSVSMPPDLTCNPFLACYKDRCYAKRMMQRRDVVGRAWRNNLHEFKKDPLFFEKYISGYLEKEKPERFRWHVGGEIPSVDSLVYFDIINNIAKKYPNTKFLIFTKMYNLVDHFKTHPDNLSIIISLWPNENFIVQSEINNKWKTIRDIRNYKIAWLSDDNRVKTEAFNPFECKNNCTWCGMCWTNKRDIVFKRH